MTIKTLFNAFLTAGTLVNLSYAVPAGFNIQGRLTDANGINKNGTFQIKFSIFASATPVAGEVALWASTRPVTVYNGNFQVILQGQELENAVKDRDAAHVEIQVGSEAPLVPRQPLLRSPFSPPAVVSGKADVLIQSDSQGLNSGNIFMKTGSNDRLSVLNNGNVGVGTTSPAEKLSVNGTVESKNGGFKFPDGTIQATALSNCTFRLKPVGGGGRLNSGESGTCSINPGDVGTASSITCWNSRGFSWYMVFSLCYSCGGAPEICGPTTEIYQVEWD